LKDKKMTLQEFSQSLSSSTPPAALDDLLQALWYDAKDDWNKAHDLVQDLNSSESSWIHAYLHRKEGDLGNASYWYSRAGRSMPQLSLKKEWEEILMTLL
jgi:hypothetical protein